MGKPLYTGAHQGLLGAHLKLISQNNAADGAIGHGLITIESLLLLLFSKNAIGSVEIIKTTYQNELICLIKLFIYLILEI